MRTASLLLLLIGASAAAQQPKPSQYPDGSAIATIGELLTRLDSLDTRLDKASRRLGARLYSEDAPNGALALPRALGQQSGAWVRYRAAECGLVGTLTGAGGSWPSAWALDCEITLTDARLGTVEAARVCVEALPAERYADDVVQCLDGLLVLGERGPMVGE